MLLFQRIARGGWRRLAPLLLALVALLVLTGCHAAVTVATQVNEDGSGQVQATVTLDPEAAAAVIDLDLSSSGLPLTDLAQAGWIVDAPEKDASGNTVIRATKEFGTPAQFAEVMTELSSPDGVFQGFTLTRTKRFARVDYEVTGTVDPSRGFAAFTDPALEAALGRSVNDIAAGYKAKPSDVDLRFDAALPGDTTTASPPGVIRTEGEATVASWQVALGADKVPVDVRSASQRVVARALLGIAVVSGVLAVLIVFARLLRRMMPDRRRRPPPTRPTSDIRPVRRPPAEPRPVAHPVTAELPVVLGNYRWLAIDGAGVLFREAEDVANILIPFARQRGSNRSDAEIEARVRALRLGRITTAEFWASIGVAGDPDALDQEYLAAIQLMPGVIRYLRGLRERGIRLACIMNEATIWASRLRANHSLESLIEMWVVSGSVGVAKPDRPLFEVLRRVTKEPAEMILLIDDDIDVLDAARSYGFATAWFTPDGRRADARDHAVIRRFGTDDELVDLERG